MFWQLNVVLMIMAVLGPITATTLPANAKPNAQKMMNLETPTIQCVLHLATQNIDSMGKHLNRMAQPLILHRDVVLLIAWQLPPLRQSLIINNIAVLVQWTAFLLKTVQRI